jgi:hypothetical protein
MTFDDVRKIALAWPEVEDGTSYGTPALKVRKKMLVRLKEDGDSQSAISKSGIRFCVRSRALTIVAHDLVAKPLTLWRIMR